MPKVLGIDPVDAKPGYLRMATGFVAEALMSQKPYTCFMILIPIDQAMQKAPKRYVGTG